MRLLRTKGKYTVVILYSTGGSSFDWAVQTGVSKREDGLNSVKRTMVEVKNQVLDLRSGRVTSFHSLTRAATFRDCKDRPKSHLPRCA